MGTHNATSASEILEFVKLALKGKSNVEIAKRTGRDQRCISRHLKRIGVPVRPVGVVDTHNFERGGWFNDPKSGHKVYHALKKGKLVHPGKCEQCGTPNTKNKNGRNTVHAHHSDYNKPLDVIFLCRKCHYEWHRTNVAIPKRKVNRAS